MGSREVEAEKEAEEEEGGGRGGKKEAKEAEVQRRKRDTIRTDFKYRVHVLERRNQCSFCTSPPAYKRSRHSIQVLVNKTVVISAFEISFINDFLPPYYRGEEIHHEYRHPSSSSSSSS